MNRFKYILLGTFILMSCFGCSMRTGPHWSKTTVTLPTPVSSIKGKKVVVSQFLTAFRRSSASHNVGIEDLLEAASVHDVSLEIVSELTGRGINARALMDAQRSDLKANEILIRGVAIGIPYSEKTLTQVCIIGGTAGIVGCILPSPIETVYGAKVKYRLEVIDSSGNILMQTGEQEIIVSYKDRFYLAKTPEPEIYKNHMQELSGKILDALIVHLK